MLCGALQRLGARSRRWLWQVLVGALGAHSSPRCFAGGWAASLLDEMGNVHTALDLLLLTIILSLATDGTSWGAATPHSPRDTVLWSPSRLLSASAQ